MEEAQRIKTIAQYILVDVDRKTNAVSMLKMLFLLCVHAFKVLGA